MGKTAFILSCQRNILPIGIFLLTFLSITLAPPISILAGANELTIEAGDVLEIEVQNEPDLSGVRVVGEDGSFQYHLLRSVQTTGKTPTQLARHMEKRLYDEEFLVNPRVTVKIKERRGHVVWVRGEVKNPGRSDLEQGIRLRDVLAQHGGILDRQAGPDVTIQGRRRPSPIRIDRHLLFSSGPAGRLLNLLLRPGDEILVPKAGEFTLAGAVRKPGRQALTQRVTLSEILSDKIGPTAETHGWVIVRSKPAQKPAEFVLNLAEIRRGDKVVDCAIQDGDQITVLAEGFFYVGGLVEHPGLQKWEKGMTLQRVLIGIDPVQQSWDGKTIEIVRWGEKKRIHYRAEKILSDRAENARVKDKDIVLILPKQVSFVE